MGWLGVVMSGAAAWLHWDSGIIWIMIAIGVGIIQLWSWGVMHNYAVMAARNRSSYSGNFFDFTKNEVAAAPNWATVVNLVSFFAAFALVITAFATKDGRQPLASSCDNWNTPAYFNSATPEEVQTCIDSGSAIGAQGPRGLLPIHGAAASSSHPAVIVKLLDAGADLQAKSDGGGTALHFAGQNPNPAIARTLVHAGAELEARDADEMTALHFAAAMARSATVIKVLVEAGAEVESRARENLTPLQIAASMNSNSEIIEVLLMYGADSNARLETGGNTPLHLAVLNSADPSVIRALLEGGADPDIRNERGETPLDVAVQTDSELAIGALLGL